ncbi:hypothetical protein GQ43DRAFT_434928 [Delitschia confertaspora ATCC 74209]|uniref:Uncharacterized protein n=1 Tax=Delitschia confertaspora ATCC 74209 TaxID=1513339 RepID=A0A9P4MV60_9PLEO|nr:hypothetical protein GQ43DRAFT_434928 [Delitschia confertaspora ATCC 74209]
MKRDQERFGMYISNDFTGYGLQEVIENQLAEIRYLMDKKPEPPAVDLWVHFSAIAHWLASNELALWMMIDDSERWKDTIFPYAMALVLDFLVDCLSMRGDNISYISQYREGFWPWKIVHYLRIHNIKLVGVYRIEKRGVEKYDDGRMASHWKKKEAIDRWGLKTMIIQDRRQLGGEKYDITKYPAEWRKKHHHDEKDPLSPRNPLVKFPEFEDEDFDEH